MGSPPRVPDEEFVRLYRELGTAGLAKHVSMSDRAIRERAARMRLKGVDLTPANNTRPDLTVSPQATHRAEIQIETGFAIIGSDFHYWPGVHTLMHRAFVWACKEFKPQLVVLNGDVMDFPTISRFPPIGWEKLPEVQDEIEFAQEKTHEIALAAGRGTRKIWTLGNHDKRFESRLANLAPQYAKVHGVHLKDHFPDWEPAWSAYVNPELDLYSCLITHRFKGGIHDIHNNLLWAGNHVVTGHTHAANVRALTYYNERTIWGVNTGMCSEPGAKAFIDYTEDNPKNWRSGFVIMRWEGKKLLQPLLVTKHDETRVEVGLDLVTP